MSVDIGWAPKLGTVLESTDSCGLVVRVIDISGSSGKPNSAGRASTISFLYTISCCQEDR